MDKLIIYEMQNIGTFPANEGRFLQGMLPCEYVIRGKETKKEFDTLWEVPRRDIVNPRYGQWFSFTYNLLKDDKDDVLAARVDAFGKQLMRELFCVYQHHAGLEQVTQANFPWEFPIESVRSGRYEFL